MAWKIEWPPSPGSKITALLPFSCFVSLPSAHCTVPEPRTNHGEIQALGFFEQKALTAEKKRLREPRDLLKVSQQT